MLPSEQIPVRVIRPAQETMSSQFLPAVTLRLKTLKSSAEVNPTGFLILLFVGECHR
jgi:hypothetical protein